MSRKGILSAALAAILAAGFAFGLPCTARACGGMFSPDGTIDQNGERVIIIHNGDGTLTAVIQNKYVGEAEDFAWVLPVSAGVTAEDVAVIDDGDALFGELEGLTTPYFNRPEECYSQSINPLGLSGAGAPPGAAGDGARSLSSGVVGPYSFDVVQTDTPTALADWLNKNGYKFTPEMEPFVEPYIDAGMVFLALQLRPGEGVDAIEPVQVTMKGDKPMIPMRMAAVAAKPDTTVVAWFFASAQTVPTNFEHILVADDEIRYTVYGDDTGSNYQDLVNTRADAAGGHAWLTEFAGETGSLSFHDERLQQMADDHPYLTRLKATLDPEQMTLDPVFDFDASQPDVPVAHNLESVPAVVADCQRQQTAHWAGIVAVWCIVPLAFLVAAVVGLIWLIRRLRPRAAA